MPVRYDQDIKAKAIRLVREHAGDYPSEYAAITAVARRLGMTPETLRKWIRQAAVDAGQAPGVSSAASKEIRELKRKVSELERMPPAQPRPRVRDAGQPLAQAAARFISGKNPGQIPGRNVDQRR